MKAIPKYFKVQRYSYYFGLHGTICSKSINSTNLEWISIRYPDNQRKWNVWSTTGVWCCYSGQMIMILYTLKMINHKMELNCTALHFWHKIKREIEKLKAPGGLNLHAYTLSAKWSLSRTFVHILQGVRPITLCDIVDEVLFCECISYNCFITPCKAGLSTMIMLCLWWSCYYK